MNRIIKIIFILDLLIVYSCGSFQAKGKDPLSKKTEAAKTTNADDEFFADDKDASFGPENGEKSAKVQAPDKNSLAAKPEGDFKETDIITDVSRGYASWYGKELQDKPTASGDLFDMNKFTAAHRTFPMGSLVLVRNLENGKKKLVRINDRGPYVDGRVIDVSFAVARDLGFAEKGVARVEIELIEKSEDDFLAKSQATAVEEKDATLRDSGEDLTDDIEKVSEKDGYVFRDGIRPQNYTVRTGAFKIPHNAEKYKEELEDKYNVNAFLGQKGKWNFVWLGDFESKDKARKFYQKLKTDGLDVLNPGKVP